MLRFPIVLALLAAALLGEAAGAAVVCQKGKKVKLRADACRQKETRIATVGGADPTGIWEPTSGTLFDVEGLRPELLVLNADGTGRLNLAGGQGLIRTCALLTHARDGNGSLVVDDYGIALYARVYRFELEGDDVLRLSDAVGQTATFERLAAVDPNRDCGSLAQTSLVTGLPRPDQSSGLAFDGTHLWYTEDDAERLLAIDPESGALAESLAIPYRYVHATQGADFWAHGRNSFALRVTRPGADVDEVGTEQELGDQVSVDAIAFRGATGTLWIHGWNDQHGRLLEVNAAAEPDALLKGFDLDASVTGMTFAGSTLYAIHVGGQSVMRIDPATGVVTGTFLIPDRSAYWRGIAAIGDRLYLLGEDSAGRGSLLEVETP